MLQKDSLEWAIAFVQAHGDGDIFPKITEVQAISQKPDLFVDLLDGIDIRKFTPKACRRFIVPKDDLSYRQATQLHPQDSIILAAIIYELGAGIETRRLPLDTVYSYRFNPTAKDGLYRTGSEWNDFWTNALNISHEYEAILYCDIADFYNQVYHHVVENQLGASGFTNETIKWILELLESTTVGVSRGLPIGPHPIHLIAEATLIPIDNSLHHQGLHFMRYADDILIFCDSEADAKVALHKIATTLDKQQRLMLQRHKTKIHNPTEFTTLCLKMIDRKVVDEDESEILDLVRRYTGGNPYRSVSYREIDATDWKRLSEFSMSNVIEDYLSSHPIDYIGLRWFYRRLAQVGHPAALDITIDRFNNLTPCFGNVCAYINSIQTIDPKKWLEIGNKMIEIMNSPEIRINEFFRLSILSLFARNPLMNHFPQLSKIFQDSDSSARREILLAAHSGDCVDWLREQKENCQHMDSWQRMAMIYGASKLPFDERKFFLGRVNTDGPFETALAKWSKSS